MRPPEKAALPHFAGAQDKGEVDDPVARLRERVEALEFALYPRGLDPALVTEDMSQMRNLAGLLVLSKFPMRDGALDVYRVADDVAEEERFRGDAPPPRAEAVPVLWDRAAQPDGTRLVALSNGAVKRMKEAEVRALLAKLGQVTLEYAKDGVSFTLPRRFRVVESQRGTVRIIRVDDPVTRSPDLFVMLHGMQPPQYFAEVYAGLKYGLKVETELEERQTRERIGDEEVTGTTLVYQSRGTATKHVLRFFTVRQSCTIVVHTAHATDAFVYRRLRAILRSVTVPQAGSD